MLVMRIGMKMQQTCVNVLAGSYLNKTFHDLDLLWTQLHLKLLSDAQQELEAELNESKLIYGSLTFSMHLSICVMTCWSVSGCTN
mgnify:CR=1 FL=1